MDCRALESGELVERYLRGELDSALQDEFEVHTLECPKCLQVLELFLTVRDDLTQRAHEIRIHPLVQRVRFRWQWVAVVSMLTLVCGLGVFSWRRNQDMTASSQLQTPVVSSPRVSSGSGKDAQESVASPSPVFARQQPKGPQLPAAKSQPANGVAPVTSSSQEPRRDEIVSVPTALPGTQAPSSQNSADRTLASVGAHPNEGVPQPGLASNEAASDEEAKELFRLGIVQAPPYTFSGLAGFSMKSSKSGKPGSPHDSALATALSNGKPGQTHSSNAGRAYFQNAMDAYVEKRYADAIDLLEEAVKVEPNAPDANFFLGICRLLQAKPADSIAPLKAALANEKSPFTQSAHFYLAKAYVQTRNLAAAEAELHAAAAMSGRLSADVRSTLNRLQALRAKEEKLKQPEGLSKPD